MHIYPARLSFVYTAHIHTNMHAHSALPERQKYCSCVVECEACVSASGGCGKHKAGHQYGLTGDYDNLFGTCSGNMRMSVCVYIYIYIYYVLRGEDMFGTSSGNMRMCEYMHIIMYGEQKARRRYRQTGNFDNMFGTCSVLYVCIYVLYIDM